MCWTPLQCVVSGSECIRVWLRVCVFMSECVGGVGLCLVLCLCATFLLTFGRNAVGQ